MTEIADSLVVPHFIGGGLIRTVLRAIPEPGPGQLLLQVKANALCGSERGQFREGWATTPGHEAAGVVVAVGPGASTPLGTLGVVYLMDFCGECRSCKVGFTNQCLAKRADMGFTHDGGYGVYELIHENIFFPVDGDLSGAEATLLLDIMGTGGHAIRRAELVRKDVESLLIAGAGPIGLGVLAMAKLIYGREFPVYITDFTPYRLSLAERLGGRPISLELGKTLEEGLGRHGVQKVDAAIDTTGKQAARQTALNALEQRGVLVLVGHGERLDLDVSPDMIAPERAVLGSEYFAFSELENNLALLKLHRDYLGGIITHRFGIGEIQQAFDLFFAGNTGKVITEQ